METSSRGKAGRRSGLADTAIDWVVRVEARDVSDQELKAFGEWLASDTEHRRAYEEADRLWRTLGRSLDRSGFEAYRAKNLSRDQTPAIAARTPWWRGRWSAAAAGSALALLLTFWVLTSSDVPEPGEAVVLSFEGGGSATKQFTLSDGTELTLGAGSAIAAELTQRSRSIILESGEAFFAVTPDPGRPFVVAAGTVQIRVTGTAFDVQRKGPVTMIAVAEGRVRVSNPKLLRTADSGSGSASTPVALDQTVVLKAGERVRATEDDGLDAVSAVEPENIGAWRRNRLVYQNVPLAAVVADLNRYDSRSFAVVDEDLGSIEISATFDNSDIDSVLTSLAELLPLEIHQTAEDELVLRRRPSAN